MFVSTKVGLGIDGDDYIVFDALRFKDSSNKKELLKKTGAYVECTCFGSRRVLFEKPLD